MRPVRDNQVEKNMFAERLCKVVDIKSNLRFTDAFKRRILSLTG